tara:strand:+ start:357 stop:1301 length:945 start_codon:yes stop_codon:yes gene_type:complete
MSVRESGMLAPFMEFNLWEYLFQLLYNALFCLAGYSLNLRPYFYPRSARRELVRTLVANLLFLGGALVLGIFLQELLFEISLPQQIFRVSYFARLGLSLVMVYISVRIIRSQRLARSQEAERNRLMNLYTTSQLQLLKSQLNPHFFFNALSVLSSIVQENPDRARIYINHLSKVFRYVLQSSPELVSLQKELNALQSYIQLIHMRFEKAVEIRVDVPESYLRKLIPHISLQPLLENAVKHNTVSMDKPLHIRVYTEGEKLVVENNLQLMAHAEEGTRTGLSNLAERFKVLMSQSLSIDKTDEYFRVYLPLKPVP